MENKFEEMAASGDVTQLIGADQMVEDERLGEVKGRFKITRLSDRQPGESWIALVYGVSKSGKTRFAGTCGPRTLFINTGDGLETLKSPAFRTAFPDSDSMLVVDVRERNPRGIAEAFDIVTEAIDYALDNLKDLFDVIVLDEATAFRKYAMNKATEINSASRTRTIRANRIQEFMKIEIEDYKIEMDMIEWFLGQYIPKFKEEKKHFLMLAHERQVFGKPSKIGEEPPLKRILPGFTGKTFPDSVPSFFDDVFRSEVVSGNKYRLRTTGNEMEVGGARHGGVFAPLEYDPNYQEMLGRIKSGKLYTPAKR